MVSLSIAGEAHRMPWATGHFPLSPGLATISVLRLVFADEFPRT